MKIKLFSAITTITALFILMPAASFAACQYFSDGTGYPINDATCPANSSVGGGGNASGATSPQDQTVRSQIITLPNPLGTTQTIPDLIGKIVDWLIYIASIAVLPFMIVWGAYQLLMAGSNPEKVIEGRHTITWAIVGYGLLLLSKSIELIIQNFLKM